MESTEMLLFYFCEALSLLHGRPDGLPGYRLPTPPSPPPGQFYVMMSPPDVLQGGTGRTIAPRTHAYSA